ncbi:Endothelin-converting enzyme 2, partial [Stegodyphus mimosarum]
MEVFEVNRRQIHRGSRSALPISNNKVPYLLVVLGTVLVTIICLIVLRNSAPSDDDQSEEILSLQSSSADKLLDETCEENFCYTKDCIHLATRMMKIMKPEIDPCENFYEYACGNYQRFKSVPYTRNYYSPIQEVEVTILRDIDKVLVMPSTVEESHTLRKIKRFYNSCMNVEQRNLQQNYSLAVWFSDIELSVNNIAGAILGMETSSVSWQQLVSRLEEYQIHTIFEPSFERPDDLPVDKIVVDCPVPFFEPDVYLNVNASDYTYQLTVYKEVIDKALELLFIDKSRRLEFMKDILSIEGDLARAAVRSPVSEDSSLSEGQKQLIREIWRPMIGEGVLDLDIVSSCKYDLESITSVLENAPRVKSTRYVAWRMLVQIMQYLGSDFRKIHLHFLSKLPRFDYAYPSKWQECTDVIRKELGLAITKALMDEGFIKAEHIAKVKEEFVEVKNDFLFAFSTVNWLDRFTSQVFLNKLQSMKLDDGYVSIINQTGVLDIVYQELEFNYDSYFLNVINLKKFETRHFFTRLWYGNPENPISEIDVLHSPLELSSSYDYKKNTIRIDLGLLRPPIFVYLKDIPKYLKYGQNAVLAREMSHAFDATGCFYDGDGNFRHPIWWPTVLERKYNELMGCIRNQTLKFGREITSTEMTNTIIGDVGSLFVPFEGLKAHLRNLEEQEKPLPAVSLSQKKTFYVQAAQVYCEDRIGQYQNGDVLSLPVKLRVNGAVSNIPDFGDVFNCPVGSAMNPETKCNLL